MTSVTEELDSATELHFIVGLKADEMFQTNNINLEADF